MAVVDRARFSIPCVSWLDSPESQDSDDWDDRCDDDDGDSGGHDNIKHLTCEIHAQASASTELSGLSQCRVLCAIITIITMIRIITIITIITVIILKILPSMRGIIDPGATMG